MNPKTNYEDIDTETARAFINLFINHGHLFKFPIDYNDSTNEELQAFVIENDSKNTNDGKSTICVKGINQKDNVEKISEILENMGLKIIERTNKEDYHISIGNYVSNTVTAFAPKDINSEWNVPHLLVYGSLSPEIEEACLHTFGNKYDYYDVRNHYVIRGKELDKSVIDKLYVSFDKVNMFTEDKRFYKSQIRQSDFI